MEIPGAGRSINDDSETEKFVPIKGNFGAHHLLWLNCLQQVEDGTIKRLMGLMPPGAGKSIYSSIVFPTHVLGRFPGTTAMVVNYGSDLPKKFGRRARTMVSSKQYRRIMDCTLSPESGAVDEWALTNGSEWMAKGILTGITGTRLDWIIWDDLIKNRADADSDVIRQKTWDEYKEALQTRRKPTSAEVGVNTRWHEDDPPGRILPTDYNGESGWIKGRDGNDWYVVCLPAECDRSDDILGRKIGEILWPEWFTPQHFAPFKQPARTWNALFQQRPAPESGDYFQADWLRPYTKQQLPPREQLTIYGASDYAVSADEGDYTVHVVVGMDRNYKMYLLDLWRAQVSSDKWVESFCNLVEQWKPLGWAEESGQIKSGVGPFLVKRLRERQLFIARAQFPAKGDKEVRAQSIRGRMGQEGLYVPVDAPWYPAFHKELMMFPAGRNDDMVDALGLIGQILDKMVRGHAPPAEPEKQKLISTDPSFCTVTLDDLWKDNERYWRRASQRIH